MSEEPTVEEPATDEEAGYTLAELAAEAGVSERTVRYYQSEKLLPKPDKRGRDGVYRPDHLVRVRLIVDLRDRGMSLGTIRELVGSEDPTSTVAAWLGVDAALRAPWSQDRPATVDAAGLDSLIGRQPPGTRAELVDAGFVRDNHDGTWTVPSPALTGHALALRAAGMDVEVTAALRDLLRRRLDQAVRDTVKLLLKRAGHGFGATAAPEDLAGSFGALRMVAGDMVAVILAQEVEQALARLADEQPREIRGRST